MSYPFQGQMGPNYPFLTYPNDPNMLAQQHSMQNQPVQKVETAAGQALNQQQQAGQPAHQHPQAASIRVPETVYHAQQPGAQQRLAGMPAVRATYGDPTGWQDDSFWEKRATMMLPDGHEVKGTYAELYRYPAAQQAIHSQYNTWKGRRTPGVLQPHPKRVIPDHQMARITTAANSMNAAIATTAPKKTVHKAAVSTNLNQPPAYTPDPDLDSPQSCRDYLAYVDPNEVRHLQFVNDDWQHVLENRKYEFIGRIFDALAHPHSQNPPTGIVLTREAQEKYHKQQNAQAIKVLALLQSNSQLKAAKALCSLLFDAAVYVHEVGIPQEVFENWQWYARKERQVERKYRLDLDSICSARLEKLVDAIKANKLVAMDVLEQSNFHRMVRDPSFYLLEKFTYLRSNKTRQENIDRHNKQDAEAAEFGDLMGGATNRGPAKGRKRKKVDRGEIMEVNEANGEDGYGDEML